MRALEQYCRQVDLDRLAHEHRLSRSARQLVGRLDQFGDRGLPIHAFASVHVAEITARSGRSPETLTTYVLATRHPDGAEYWWADAADGFGVLGVCDLPLTFVQAVDIVEGTVVAQEAHALVDGADRSGYRLDRLDSLRISSRFYPALPQWFRRRCP